MLTLRHTSPITGYRGLRQELDQLFNGLFNAPLPGPRAFPAMNIWDAGDALYAESEVPGLRMEDLEILVTGNELTLKGRRAPVQHENAHYLRRERSAGEFTRVITLPDGIDTNAVEATLKDGVLTIKLPKAPEVQPRKITVQSA